MPRDASIERGLRALPREGPPPDLRARVLSLAQSIERPRVTLTERAWASRPLWLAWAASMAILVLLDPAPVPGAPAGGAGRERREASRAALSELAREADLPGDRLRSIVYRREIQIDINNARPEAIADLEGGLEI